jgi:hypothetical protein
MLETIFGVMFGDAGEHFGNPLGTSRERSGNTLGNRENWRNKTQGTLRAWLHFPLVGWNFSPQKGSSHFFAWAITPRNEHPDYIGEKGRILGKTYGFDTRCYWEHPWGTHWKLGEQLGNMVGTHEQLIKKKPLPFPPALKTQIKKLGHLNGCCTFPLASRHMG